MWNSRDVERRRLVVAVAIAAAVSLAGGVVVLLTGGEPSRLPTAEARAFLATWAGDDPTALDALAVAGDEPAAEVARFAEELGVVSSRFDLGVVRREEGGATATFTARHVISGVGEWRRPGRLRLVRGEDEWKVDWGPDALHPSARAGERFTLVRTRPPRAAILADDGTPLTSTGDVVTIGVEPRRIRDRAVTAAALRTHLGVAPERLDRALAAPGVRPDHFLPLEDVPPDRFAQLRPALEPVPGVVFRRRTGRTAVAGGFAEHTVGRVGEITAELLEELGPTYRTGDAVGRSGLERSHERQLAGTPSADVAVGEPARVIGRIEGRAPQPLRTTLRVAVQQAAEDALAGVTQPAAIVAVDARTGALLAAASRPFGTTFNRALDGRYPPGSTFKVVTAEALLATGATPGEPVECPREAVVGGRRFRNFEDEALGATTLRDAFAHSCNTTFAQESAELGADALEAAARRFGFSARDFPHPRDTVELAAAAIGQARVLATPAQMAAVVAAADSGTWHAPHVVTAGRRLASSPITAAAVPPLREMLRAVVTEGTGTAARRVPGLVGKTGTAEFGSGDPLPTHAWFIGVRNGIGLAVVIEGGGVGGRVAAPIAARFAAEL